jgi:hypothetical protein
MSKSLKGITRTSIFKLVCSLNGPSIPNLLWCKHNFQIARARIILISLSHDKFMMHVFDGMHSTNPCNHDFVFLSFLIRFGGFSRCSSSAPQLWTLCKALSFRWFIIIHNLVHVVDSLFVFSPSARLYITTMKLCVFFVYDDATAASSSSSSFSPKMFPCIYVWSDGIIYHKIVSWIMKSMFWKNEFFEMMIMLIDCFNVATTPGPC